MAVSLPLDNDLVQMSESLQSFQADFDRDAFAGEPMNLVQLKHERQGDYFSAHSDELVQFDEFNPPKQWVEEQQQEWNNSEQQYQTEREERQQRIAEVDNKKSFLDNDDFM